MLVLTVIALAAGLLVGRALGGRLTNLRHLALRATWVLYLSVLVGVVLPILLEPSSGLTRALVALSYLGVLSFLLLNLRGNPRLRAGLAVIAVGWLLNFLPIVANGGMPLSTWAHAEAGRTDTPTPGRSDFFKIVIADPQTPLRQLGDVIPLRPLRLVVSAGDLVMMAGMALTIAHGMRARRSPQP